MHTRLPVSVQECAIAVQKSPALIADSKGRTTQCQRVTSPLGWFQRAGMPGRTHTVSGHGSLAQTTGGTGGRWQRSKGVESVGAIELPVSISGSHGIRRENSAKSFGEKPGVALKNTAVAHRDSVTQQNAAMGEDLAAAAQSVYGRVRSAGNSMRPFRLVSGEQPLSQTDAVQLRRNPAQATGHAEPD